MNGTSVPMPASSVTGGEAIVEALLQHGIDTVFGLPGAQIYPVFDALKRREDKIRTVVARHEQSAAYAAFGAARSTGKPAVFVVVPGPGILNATGALCTAMGANAPVLCLTGQVPSDFLGRGRGHLHELPDQLATMRTIVKWAARVERPQDTFKVIADAFAQMTTGRPGPVVVEMCWDVMADRREVRVPPLVQAPSRDELLDASAENIAEFVAISTSAARPMIICGSGAQIAAQQIQDLSKLLTAPVVGFRGGRGTVPEWSPTLENEMAFSEKDLAEGPIGISAYAGATLFTTCDLVIGIGTRLELPLMRWNNNMMQCISRTDDPRLTGNTGKRIKFVRIEIDSTEAQRVKCDLTIVGDSARVISQLNQALRGANIAPKADYRAQVYATARDAQEQIFQAVQPQSSFLTSIRTLLPSEGFFVEELSQVGFASYVTYPVLRPRRYVSPGFQGTLGFGFMTSLGVKVANPSAPVVSINGDGGFQFGIMELATAAQEGIGVVVLIFNNSSYGNVMRDQDRGFGGRRIGSEFNPVRYADVAKAMGFVDGAVHVVDFAGISYSAEDGPAAAVFQKRMDEFSDKLATALKWSNAGPNGHGNGPSLIEIVLDPGSEASAWQFIMPKLDWS
ncbi:thiamine pyrophosphate enzyme, N-terminal TPP binding domain-containing protein [Hyaloraphidium curvatum]|nr:thiamine pyrophosphate enzyme, N-terminal TPP binding domain-containing protein [Hyaloraphidium curvatum]